MKRHREKRWLIKKSIHKIILLALLVFILVGILAVNVYITTRDISGLNHVLPQPTVIYDRHGEVASTLLHSKIKGIEFEEVPNHVVNAVISVEDHRFYKHNGIDYLGILRAMFRNILAGEVVEGGSTITQQLTKNVFLTNDQTLSRKWEEYFLAQKIERTYSKNEILEMYLNQIYFGEGAWGIRNAAELYFGKKVQELTINESAILVGLIKAPSRLSPLKNFEKSMERRDIVLTLMHQHGYITEEEMNQAKAQEIVLEGKQLDPYEGQYPYYVDHIIEEAIEKYGLTQNEILSGGLHIYTELDQRMQKAAEQVYKNSELFPKGTSEQIVQSGTVLLDPKTGGINAIVGGRGEHVFRGFNHATQLERQPGSTMKPLAAYTPALEQGYSVFEDLPDLPMSFNGYKPSNFSNNYKGMVTMYDALRNSYNIPAVWMLNKVGLKSGIDAVERFGISLSKEDHNLSLALGGLQHGVSPLQMAEAYSTFPNNGVRHEAHAIKKVFDIKGDRLAVWQEESVQVTSPQVSERMTFMLKGVVDEGSGKNARISGRELAGKTGSTQVPISGIDGVKDQWFVGYTPDVVGAIWLGYDKTDKNHYLTTTSGTTAAVIFKEIMSAALEGTPSSSFNLPAFQSPKPIQRFDDKDDDKKEERRGRGKGEGKGKGNKWKDDDDD
ncbi:PBP1A family penicillin-binding protein [Cytobacillus suaedae]|nr:PBP1A family penicillin-binding protein [Cytobacillus suaedae]